MSNPLISFITTLKTVETKTGITETITQDFYIDNNPTPYDIDCIVKCYRKQLEAMQHRTVYNNKPHQKEYVINITIKNGSEYLK